MKSTCFAALTRARETVSYQLSTLPSRAKPPVTDETGRCHNAETDVTMKSVVYCNCIISCEFLS